MFYKPEYESDYQSALKNMTIFARASENEQSMSALMRQTGEEYWQTAVRAVRSVEDGAARAAFLRRVSPTR